MGGKRRKATAGPLKKESKYKIPSRFDCPLCDAKSSIAVRLFRATGEATVYCRVCKVGQGRRWTVLPLEAAVDVFFRFREELTHLDQQYLAAQEQQQQQQQQQLPSSLQTMAAHGGAADDDDGNDMSRRVGVTAATAAAAPTRVVRSLAELAHAPRVDAAAPPTRTRGSRASDDNDDDKNDDDNDNDTAQGLQLFAAPLDDTDAGAYAAMFT